MSPFSSPQGRPNEPYNRPSPGPIAPRFSSAVLDLSLLGLSDVGLLELVSQQGLALVVLPGAAYVPLFKTE